VRACPGPDSRVAGTQVGILFSEQTDPTGRIDVVVKDVYQGTPAADSGAAAGLAFLGRARWLRASNRRTSPTLRALVCGQGG